jgi:predicted RNA binding protein YcfA (HicA-like mRNA interferase family)
MTVGEATKKLLKLGYIQLNQVGSHIKFGKDNDRITLLKRKSDKELVNPAIVKKINSLI